MSDAYGPQPESRVVGPHDHVVDGVPPTDPERSPRGRRQPLRSGRSVFADLLPASRAPAGLTIADSLCLIAGFAFAGFISRDAMAVVRASESVVAMLMASLCYGWLGAVMAGPVVLAVRRIQYGRRARRSMGERLWSALGAGWLLVAALRAFGDLAPVGAENLALFLATLASVLGPALLVYAWRIGRWRPATPESTPWCDRFGIACVAMWPCGLALAVYLLTL